MSWVFRNKYVGPDRRSKRLAVRFFERRRDDEGETSSNTENALQELVGRGLRWVDHLGYFGPDRRGEDFRFFFWERRQTKSVGEPPSLHVALRQLRVRVMTAEGGEGRAALRERLAATALLANAQGLAAVADSLTTLAERLGGAVDDPRPWLHSELNRIESMFV